MTEIRPVRRDEADDYLHLLCDVFGLDFNRAYSIFFTEPMFDLNRKWALFEGSQMVSILTTTPLVFGWGRAIGIAGVATRFERRGEGYASRLMQKVLSESEKQGEGPAMLFAKETTVYERNGFEPIDRVIRAPLHLVEEGLIPDSLLFGEVRELYTKWSEGHPDRLVRDEYRWNYWRWHYRICTPYDTGYLCCEGSTFREGLFSQPGAGLPLPEHTEWFGTAFMADQVEIPLHDPVVELYLMGRGVPGIPQMFMTDQF